MTGTRPVLDRLAGALADERQALVDADAAALMQATREKLSALRELESAMSDTDADRLAELAEQNRANGALLARRRREVNWALRSLGRSESAPGYDASGGTELASGPRDLAVA